MQHSLYFGKTESGREGEITHQFCIWMPRARSTELDWADRRTLGDTKGVKPTGNGSGGTMTREQIHFEQWRFGQKYFEQKVH